MLFHEKKRVLPPKKIKIAVLNLLILLFLNVPGLVSAEYPRIKQLQNSDIYYQQLQRDVAEFYRDIKTGQMSTPPVIYSYRPSEGDTLFTLASRLTLPYDSIASLNRLATKDIPEDLDTLLIPSKPGLFVPVDPESDFERYLLTTIDSSRGMPVIVDKQNKRHKYIFLPGQRFSKEVRSFFLNVFFTKPVSRGAINSYYGLRMSPVRNVTHYHTGIDISAPDGTSVVPAREGRVIETGFDNILGKYVIIMHEGGYQTHYAHLKKVSVQLNQDVSSTMIIGEVGSTGLSTGPHLHFEIRYKGRPVDPLTFLLKAGY
jgi:murein DD-endopeptidase MepM/ murein hydrolase activator NlpD